eukprot:TRINITY_DN20555_c0_g1_i1.p1 TRINITY_DN20555_c0_g1~~TRINITY_DN20555_c0_g1_i1.p1  ORF type:complete len:771 (-),score=152.02 TRINITY_DN20555_c0_g1_i1:9-2321(-)
MACAPARQARRTWWVAAAAVLVFASLTGFCAPQGAFLGPHSSGRLCRRGRVCLRGNTVDGRLKMDFHYKRLPRSKSEPVGVVGFERNKAWGVLAWEQAKAERDRSRWDQRKPAALHPPASPRFIFDSRDQDRIGAAPSDGAAVQGSIAYDQQASIAAPAAGDGIAGPSPDAALAAMEEGPQVAARLRELAMSKEAAGSSDAKQLVASLAARAAAQADRGALQAEELAASLRGIAASGVRRPEVKAHIMPIADSLLGRSMDLGATGTADSLFAVAAFKDAAPTLQALLPVLVVRLARNAPAMSPEETAESLWSCGMLREQLKASNLNMAPLLSFLTQTIATKGVTSYSLQALANLLWSTAVIRTLPNKLLEVVVKMIIKEVKDRPMKDFDAKVTYTMLWAIGNLQDTVVRVELRELLPQLRDAMTTQAEHMTCDEISACLWAFATASIGDSEGTKETQGLVEKIRNEVGLALDNMMLPEFSLALWSFAALNYRDEDLLTIAVDHFVAVNPLRKKPQHLAKAIPRITWAFAVLDFLPVRMITMLSELLVPSSGVMRFLGPDQLHSLIWSLKPLDRRQKSRCVTAPRYAISSATAQPATSSSQIEQATKLLEKMRDDLEFKVRTFCKMKRTHGTQVVEAWNHIESRLERRVQKTCTGRLEPYVAIDPAIPEEMRVAAMVKAAVAMGERGPDTPIQRRTQSGRPNVSSKRWVLKGDRFEVALGSKLQELRRLKGVPEPQMYLGRQRGHALPQGSGSVKELAGIESNRDDGSEQK